VGTGSGTAQFSPDTSFRINMAKASSGNGATRPRDRLKVRSSGVHGRGVYTTARIRKGARIIEYTGRHLPWKEAEDKPPRDPANPYHTFLFSLDNGDVIDASDGGNESRWINHSCDPNCETIEESDRIFVHALRGLDPGEELFYDYKMVPSERRTRKLEREYACLCRTDKCRGTLLEPVKKRRRK
jgi:SET domain-containing protein